jgi:hypothetical protein
MEFLIVWNNKIKSNQYIFHSINNIIIVLNLTIEINNVGDGDGKKKKKKIKKRKQQQKKILMINK